MLGENFRGVNSAKMINFTIFLEIFEITTPRHHGARMYVSSPIWKSRPTAEMDNRRPLQERPLSNPYKFKGSNSCERVELERETIRLSTSLKHTITMLSRISIRSSRAIVPATGFARVVLRTPALRSISYTSSLLNQANAKQGSQTSGKTQDKKKAPSTLWPRIKSATSFSLNAVLVLGAVGVSTVVIYLIGSELFSPSGDTQLFNRAVSMVQKDKDVRAMLQSNDTLYNERLKAYGELITHDRWTRNRPIVSQRRVDAEGNVHCFLRFHIESKKKVGLVHCEALEKKGKILPDFVSLYVDIPGEKRHFLIRPKLKKTPKATGFLGLNWGPKKA